MFKSKYIVPIVIGLSFIILYGFDKIYYADRVPFFCPIQLEGEVIPIRHDTFGDGHFRAKRKNGRSHKGLDVSAPVGDPVYAAKSGWAIVRNDPYGYGKFIKINHSDGFSTLYAHLKETRLGWIRKVRQGDIIGAVGKSGNAQNKSMKSHLHFEVRKNGEIQNPLKLLQK